MLGDLEHSLASLVDRTIAAGFRPLHADTASESEWDEFEWNTYRGLENFATKEPRDPLAPKARALADARRTEYLAGYRGTLGFAYIVLTKP
jgi:hypothetical protein